MPNCHFINFDITVRGPQAPYTVMAHFAGNVAEGTLDQESSLPFWQEAEARLGNMSHPPGNDLMAELGARLYAALMVGDVQQLWSRARTVLHEPDVSGLRLRLALYPPTVASLPWECLYDPDRRELFAASGRTPLVRVENQDRYLSASRSLRTDLPVTILVAAPEDPTGVIQAEQARQLADLLRVFGEEIIRVELMTGRFGLVDLSRRLEDAEADLLHISTHGEPDGILLWQDDAPTFVSAHALRIALDRTRHVKFVLLNACLTGQSSDRTPFSTIGPQLLQAGLPAVVAMQYEIDNHDAAEFSQFLYEELLAGPCPGAIDAAVGYARSNLYMRDPHRFTYGTPVLWLNAHDGQIFHLSDGAQERLSAIGRATLSTPSSPSSPATVPVQGTRSVKAQDANTMVEAFDARRYTDWLAKRQADVEHHRESPTWRLLRFEWQNITREYAAAIQQVERLVDESTDSAVEFQIGVAVARVDRLQNRAEELAQSICAATDAVPHNSSPNSMV